MDTAATELECFRALQKQEQLAASHRINSLWEEVQKQKELERTLQMRYGDLVAELDRTQHLMEKYRVQAEEQEAIAAKNHTLELAKAAEDQTLAQSILMDAPILSTDPIGSSHDGNAVQPMDAKQEHASPKSDMDVDAQNEHPQLCMVENLPTSSPTAVEQETTTPVQGNTFEGTVIQLSPPGRDNPQAVPSLVTVTDSGDGAAGANITTEVTKENPYSGDQQNVAEAVSLDGGLSKQEDCVPETAGNDSCSGGDAMQVSGGEGGHADN